MSRFVYRLLPAALVGVLLATSLPLFVPKAHACSCGSGVEEAWARAEYVVVGRVSGWELLSDPNPVPSFLTIELTVEVEGVLKGEPPAPLTFVERASYLADPADPAEQLYQWAGSSGSCGIFDADPTGVRALYALSSQPDGVLVTSLCSGNYVGPELGVPAGATTSLDDVIARAEAALGPVRQPRPAPTESPPTELASTESAPTESDSRGISLPVLILAVSGVALAVLATGGLLLVRRK